MSKTEIDTRVSALMDKVKAKRAAVGELTKPHWITSCRLELPGFDAINIQVEKSTTLLAVAIGHLRRMENDASGIKTELDVPIEATWQSYQIKDWCEDLILRIRIINKQAEQQKLIALEKQLMPLLSEDQRRAMALAEIEKQLE